MFNILTCNGLATAEYQAKLLNVELIPIGFYNIKGKYIHVKYLIKPFIHEHNA